MSRTAWNRRLAPAWSVGSAHDLAVPLACPIVPLAWPHLAEPGGQQRAVKDSDGGRLQELFPQVIALFTLVRRARDSNPRGRSGYRPNGFQVLAYPS
jgi:hypothetical protein